MATRSDIVPAANDSTNAVARIDYLGPAPLIEGEDQEAYNRLLDQISTTVKPADTLEDMWVRDVVDLTWELMRYRRLSASLVSLNLHKGIYEIVSSLMSAGEASELSFRYQERDPEALIEVRNLLASKGLGMDAVTALSFAAKLKYMERIDRLASNAERRRNAALIEIQLHRARLAQALRAAVKKAEDADCQVEYEEVASESPDGSA